MFRNADGVGACHLRDGQARLAHSDRHSHQKRGLICIEQLCQASRRVQPLTVRFLWRNTHDVARVNSVHLGQKARETSKRTAQVNGSLTLEAAIRSTWSLPMPAVNDSASFGARFSRSSVTYAGQKGCGTR